jgi:N utilization substance protein B
MEITRNKLQEIAMNIIYQALIYQDMNESFDIKELISLNLNLPFEEVDIFVRQVVVSAILHQEEAIESFSANMTTWKFSRLAMVMRAILLLSYVHYYYIKDVDKIVVIDVAVNLAKKYLGENDYKFINGILETSLK